MNESAPNKDMAGGNNFYIGKGSCTRGSSMKSVDKTEDGLIVLQDSKGQRYTRDKKGTIRKIK